MSELRDQLEGSLALAEQRKEQSRPKLSDPATWGDASGLPSIPYTPELLPNPTSRLFSGLVKHSPTIGKIGAALAKAQGQIKGAAKDSTNPHFQSHYADLASVAEACRAALSSNEIAVVQSP